MERRSAVRETCLVDAGSTGRAPTNGSSPRPPLVVGIGGTSRPESTTERALRVVLAAAEQRGAETMLLGASDLDLPMYAPGSSERTPAATLLVEAIARADGIVIASPGYHGGVSGLVKNALDYVEDLRDDERPYFEGRAVGCVSCAFGWQAPTATLLALRTIVHALRGWPTPLGVALNSAMPLFDPDGEVIDRDAAAQLDLLGDQVVAFAQTARSVVDRAL